MKSFLEAVAVIGEISPRSNDVIISVGERLSAKLFSVILKEKSNLNAVFLSLENLLDSKSNSNSTTSLQDAAATSIMTHSQDQAFYDSLKEKMATAVLKILQDPTASMIKNKGGKKKNKKKKTPKL